MSDQIGIQGDDAHVEGGIHFHQHSAPPPVIPRQLQPLDACFLGRDKELAELLEQLQPGKIAAVCGPGGMGKSALAVQAVQRLEADRFPDGIVFHSFYHQPSTDMALQTICTAFKVEAKEGLAGTVRQVLAGRKALLILDGAEEADDLKAVLDLRSTCGVLITSRKRADAQGFRLDLKPLEKQPAAAVFLQHSRDTACCVPTTADDASVQGICKILDGWPVGLRIAGRYCSSTGESAADYLCWLEQEPFKELGDGEHQDENAALLLRRSVAQVNDDARLALGVAGTLAFAPIAREPVAAILEDDERRARKALGDLVNYGLLEKREERWQVSHALVHTFARTKLILSKRTLSRLVWHYIGFCKEQGCAGRQGFFCLDKERAHCLRLIENCSERGFRAGLRALVYTIYPYLNLQGYWLDQLTIVNMQLDAARQEKDRWEEAWCLNSLGYTYGIRGNDEKALEYYKQGFEIRSRIGDKHGVGASLGNIAGIYNRKGANDKALQKYKQSLTIMQETGDKALEGAALNGIAGCYNELGDYENTLKYLIQSLTLRKDIGDREGEGVSLNNIGRFFHDRGDLPNALDYYKQARVICHEIGERRGETTTCWNIGFLYAEQGNWRKCEEYWDQAVQIGEVSDSPDVEKYRKGLERVRAKRQGAQEA